MITALVWVSIVGMSMCRLGWQLQATLSPLMTEESVWSLPIQSVSQTPYPLVGETTKDSSMEPLGRVLLP